MTQPFYTSVERVYSLEPAVGSVADLNSAQIMDSFIAPAEAIINATIARMYVIPIAPAPALLVGIADDMAVYRILTRRIYTAQQLKNSAWPDRFKESMEYLDRIAKGELLLTLDDGSVAAANDATAPMASNTMDFLPTMFEGRPEDWYADYDKLANAYSDRGMNYRDDSIWQRN